ncbi:hypothetical protein BREVUG8_40245 [Brevundimonas sp. G8]|nr:hypothetical protein BREVUG8_40245 [Brevundimonas sp. G8]
MVSHHLTFKVCPMGIGDFRSRRTNKEVVLVAQYDLSIRHLECHLPSMHFGTGLNVSEAGLLHELSSSGIFEGFTDLQPAAGGSPEDPTCEWSILVIEPEQ